MTGDCERLQPTLLCPVLSVAFFLAGILTSLTDTLAGDHTAPFAYRTGLNTLFSPVTRTSGNVGLCSALVATIAVGDGVPFATGNADTGLHSSEIAVSVPHKTLWLLKLYTRFPLVHVKRRFGLKLRC